MGGDRRAGPMRFAEMDSTMTARLAIALVLVSTIPTFAQPVLRPARVTFTIVQKTLADVFDAITRVTGVAIEFDDDALAEAKSHEVKEMRFVNARLNDVLPFVIRDSRLTFEVVDENTVRIRLKQ